MSDAQARGRAGGVARRSYGKPVAFLTARTLDVAAAKYVLSEVRSSAHGLALSRTRKMPTPSIVAIAVVSDEDRNRLIELLRFLNVDVISHESLKTLRTCILRRDIDLVITDVTLPDGNWVDVLRLTVQASPSPGILVHSRVVNDRLWSEVLWGGAYDMLIAPYSVEDGCSIIQSALRAGCILAENRPTSLRY